MNKDGGSKICIQSPVTSGEVETDETANGAGTMETETYSLSAIQRGI